MFVVINFFEKIFIVDLAFILYKNRNFKNIIVMLLQCL